MSVGKCKGTYNCAKCKVSPAKPGGEGEGTNRHVNPSLPHPRISTFQDMWHKAKCEDSILPIAHLHITSKSDGFSYFIRHSNVFCI